MDNPSKYDPRQPCDYLHLLRDVFRAFSEVASHEELVQRLGVDLLADVSELPEWKQLDQADPLPPGFSQRIYQFRHQALGRGPLEAVFHDSTLVNVRIQLVFSGWFAKSRAKRYYREILAPNFKELLGPASDEGPYFCSFTKSGLVALTRYVPETPSVSSYFTDKRYH